MAFNKTSIKNPFTIDVTLNKQTHSYVQNNYILPQVRDFLAIRGITNASEISSKNCITDLNFHSVDIQYFYKKLLKNIKKEQNSIDLVQYVIIYDKKFATLQCEQTKLFYNELLLGKNPILYFIYFNLQELLDVIRQYASK